MDRPISRPTVSLLAICTFLTATALAQSPGQAKPQTQVSPQSMSQPVAPEKSQPPLPKDVRILFTGRLLGHLALPEQQVADPLNTGCPATPEKDDKSTREARFINQVRKQGTLDSTLVLGMGDNFAPVLYARQFSKAPDAKRRSKELNTWVWPDRGREGKWIPIQSNEQWKREVPEEVQKAIREGRGVIPTDNVGCFLTAAGYDAIVPGVDDFYFGPERLRHLARFLATPREGDNRNPVQMLAANLVIQTTHTNPHTPLSDKERKLTYEIKHEGLTVQNITDGKPVLPWLQYIEIKSEKIQLSVGKLCKMNPKDAGVIEDCSIPLSFDLTEESKRAISDGSKPKVYRAYFRGLDRLQPAIHDASFTNLEELQPGTNYAFCTTLPNPQPQQKDGFCVRFSVYYPFFLYPNSSPKEETKYKEGQRYADPKPYVLKKLGNGTEVAVFGVVDPNLRNYVGSLNYVWENTKKNYKTEVTVIDPAEALTQQLEYFDRQYKREFGSTFKGIKILLAQMSPPLARQLAASLQGKFNVVLSEAESEQATPNGVVLIKPLVEDRESTGGKKSQHGTVNAVPSFVAVPPPYFDSSIERPVLQIRQLDVSDRVLSGDAGTEHHQHDSKSAGWEFEVSGERFVEPESESSTLSAELKKEKFDEKVTRTWESLVETDPDSHEPKDGVEKFKSQMKSVTLFALKRKFNADVALMQKRDFYFGPFPGVVEGSHFPELIDRILWKGDLAMLVMVKGSTLDKVLKESDQYDDQDKQALSLELKRERGLVRLGVFKDTSRKEYLINGEVLDPNRLYSVATTDFIGAGDTGYPEMAEPELDNPKVPQAFPKTLYTISGLVCQQIRNADPNGAHEDCPGEIPRWAYLDESSNEPVDKGPWLTSARKFLSWTYLPLLWDPDRHLRESRELRKENREEFTEQDRRVWFISHSSSLSLTAINNSISEEQRKALFSGITLPNQLQAKESHELSISLTDRLGFSGRRADFYLQPELNYDHVVTSQENAPAASNFKQNLLAGELGWFIHRSKNYPRLGVLLSIRDETEFLRPVETVKLADAKKSELTFDRARGNSVFGHFGFRLQNRQSYFEGGFEVGEVKRVTAFNFTTPTGTVSCPFAAAFASSEPECVKANSDDSAGKTPSITKDSVPSALLGTALRYGWFSKMKLVVPIVPRLSYEFINEFEYSYAGKGSISTDMLYRDLWTNSLSIKVTRNFSVEPKFMVFFYENQVEHNTFRQLQSSIALKYVFDWFAGTRWRTALLYTEPKK